MTLWQRLLVMVGLGLNLRASILLGPHLRERFGVTPGVYVVLIGLPVVVAALVRLPVGVLTDRYGVRVMFPAVSLTSAAAVTGLGLAGSLPAAIVAGAVAGAGSSAYVVGAAFVTRLSPYGRLGRELGIFGLGVALAVLFSVASWAGELSALVLAGTLVLFAVLAAVLIRDPVTGDRAGSPIAECVTLIRLASTSSVTLLYALALSGMLSIAVFLPVYLSTALHFDWLYALAITGSVAALAAVARLVGGWRADRRPTTRRLVTCYGIAAVLCLAVPPAPSRWPAVLAIGGIAVCDGVAGGTLLALIGKAARPYNAGAVMGATGAVGALGALVPPLLFAGLPSLPAWILPAVALLAAAIYVRARDLRVGLGLAVGFHPEPRPTSTTVAILGEADTRLGAAALVGGLAELAISDELVVVYGVDERPRRGLSADALADGLRARLPRHDVVAVTVDERPEMLGQDALILGEYVDAGTLTIAVTGTASRDHVAADLSIYLQADRTLTIFYDPARGSVLAEAGTRAGASDAGPAADIPDAGTGPGVE